MRLGKLAAGILLCAAMLVTGCGGGGDAVTAAGPGEGTGTTTVDPPTPVLATRYAYGQSTRLNSAVALSTFTVNPTDGTLAEVDVIQAVDWIREMVVAPNSRFLYVGTNGTVTTYAIDPVSGKLSYRQDLGSRANSDATNSVSLLMDPKGRFLYKGAMGLLDAYRIDPVTGTLTLVSTTSLPSPYLARLGIDGGGRFVFWTQGTDTVQSYRIGVDGGLTPAARTQLDVYTSRLVMDPKGDFVYTTFWALDPVQTVQGVLVLEIDPATGALAIVDSLVIPDVGGVYAEPGGRYLYVSHNSSYRSGEVVGPVSAYRIHRDTGGLEFTGTADVPQGVFELGTEPSGKLVYVRSGGGSPFSPQHLTALSIDQGNGTLTRLSTTTPPPITGVPLFAN